MENLALSLKLALRQLRRNMVITLTVVITLAIAIGANTAVFSILNAVLLKSLPYPQPERMGTIYERGTGTLPTGQRSGLDGERWELLRDNVPSLLSAISGTLSSGVNIEAGSQARYLHAGRVSQHYFEVLALPLMLGRSFSAEEDRPHGPKVAILSYGLWSATFAGNPQIIGQSLLLKGEPYTIIGVLPQDAVAPLHADLYTALQPGRDGEGQGTNFAVITRLRDRATWQQADGEINRAWAASTQRLANHDSAVHVLYYSVPLQTGETNALRPQVLTLMLAAGSILFIACANLAGLTLVRMLRRTGEIATRLALGASRWQIQKQLWMENLVLATAGGLAGIGVGFVALRAFLLLLPADFLPVATVSLDGRVLGFTVVLSLLTCVLFGMLPALISGKVAIRSSMGSRSVIDAGNFRLREGLIAGEVALTVVLLAAAGLLIRTLVHLETSPRGFNPAGVLSAKASLDDAHYRDPAAFRSLLDHSIAAMREIPGVRNAAVGLTLPYERALNDGVVLSDGVEAGQQFATDEVYVTPGYFDTLRIPVLAGRMFTEADGPDTQQVVIVNQAFSRKFFHGGDPVGRYLNKNMRVIGVVGDTVLSSGLTAAAPLTSEETIFLPAAQLDGKFLVMVHTWFQPSWLVRTARPVQGLQEQMERALRGVDPNLPFSGFYTMNDLMKATLANQRIAVALLSVMASLALLLSAMGIFSLVANLVTQRTREIGIRIALGSTIPQAMMLMGRSGVGASAAGLLAGLGLCAVSLHAMRSVLYGVGTYDVTTMVGVVLTLIAVTLLAATLPTLRVARIDPATTLRAD